MVKLAQTRSVFQPQMRVIISITNANPCVITTSTDGINPANHNYINGLIVRIDVPVGFGMQQINQQTGIVTVLSPTTFSLPINTINYDPYIVPPINPGTFPYSYQAGQSVPVGEINDIITGATQNVLPF
jgi:hypothetical protein